MLVVDDDEGVRTAVAWALEADGFEVRNPSGDTIAKVKVREGRLAFETESGDRLAVAKGVTDARAGTHVAEVPDLAVRADLRALVHDGAVVLPEIRHAQNTSGRPTRWPSRALR